MWSLYLAIGAGSIPVSFLINDDDEEKVTLLAKLIDLTSIYSINTTYVDSTCMVVGPA